MVTVLDVNNKKLYPCSNVIARLLLKEDKAKVFNINPFAIKLKTTSLIKENRDKDSDFKLPNKKEDLEKFMNLHFSDSSFDGNIFIGCRGRKSTALVPALTSPIKSIHSNIMKFYTVNTADYYISSNTFTSIHKKKEDLFSLNNIVIDIDCHNINVSYKYLSQQLIPNLVWRLQHDIFDAELPCPTSIVYSGRGLQLWWSLNAISSKFAPFFQQIVDYFMFILKEFLNCKLNDEFSYFNVDETASRNIAGYFRLPGTFNTVSCSKVTFDYNGNKYNLMELFDSIKVAKSELDTLKNNHKPIIKNDYVKKCVSSDNFLMILDGRIQALEKLKALRNRPVGNEERNNLCFIYYNTLVTTYGHELAYQKTSIFNQTFKKPFISSELDNAISSAKKKNGYYFSTLKIIEFLSISESEAFFVGFDINFDSYFHSSNKQKAKTKLKKDDRNQKVMNLYNSGKSAVVVAKEMSLSAATVHKIIKDNGLHKKDSRKDIILHFNKEGKTYKEIALLCNCSVKTVQRALVG